MKRLVLIDGHAILHRAYHAFPKTLRTRRGEIVNAVYGFTRMLLGVIEALRPEYLVVTFDLPKPTFRHREYVGYQAQRPKTDTELINQIKRVHQVVKTLNIPIFEKEGFEADDVIGTLARQASARKVKSIIVTGDRDIMQLVTGRVKLYVPMKGFSQAKLFGPRAVKELLGVKPEQIVDYKALVGDPSDNYPGVPGVGPKTAVKLLSQYGNLDTIYKNLPSAEPSSSQARNSNFSSIRPIVAQRLKNGRASAVLSKKLAQIVTNVPVKLKLRDCRVHDYDREKTTKLFEELEFRSLIRRLPGTGNKKVIKEQDNKEKNKQMKLI